MMSYFLYILFCDEKEFYVGITKSLETRIQQHKNKQSKYTKRFNTIKFVYSEQFDNRTNAENREKQLKGWSQKKKIALIRGDIKRLKLLAKP